MKSNKSQKNTAIQDISTAFKPIYKSHIHRKKKKKNKIGLVKKYLFKYLFKGIEAVGAILQILQMLNRFFKKWSIMSVEWEAYQISF